MAGHWLAYSAGGDYRVVVAAMSIGSRIREELESRLASETVEDFDMDFAPDGMAGDSDSDSDSDNDDEVDEG